MNVYISHITKYLFKYWLQVMHCMQVLRKYWWRGVVANAFRLKRSYSTPGPVSTAMGTACWQVNHLGAKPAS